MKRFLKYIAEENIVLQIKFGDSGFKSLNFSGRQECLKCHSVRETAVC